MPVTAKSRGRPFKKGEVANPAGRPPGIPDRRTKYRTLLEAHTPDLVERCVALAMAGDVQAMRLCLERVLPPVKAVDEPVAMTFANPDNPAECGREVVAAVSAGVLSPAAGATLMGTLETLSKLIEAEELQERIAAMERKLGMGLAVRADSRLLK